VTVGTGVDRDGDPADADWPTGRSPPGPVRVERRASNSGVVMVVGQKIALGRVHAHKTVIIDVTTPQLVVHCDDGARTYRRTTDQPVTRIKAHRPCNLDV
jgi:hypothetical protein